MLKGKIDAYIHEMDKKVHPQYNRIQGFRDACWFVEGTRGKEIEHKMTVRAVDQKPRVRSILM
jgi:hypothetical protein